jgi:hypothetical protein
LAQMSVSWMKIIINSLSILVPGPIAISVVIS